MIIKLILLAGLGLIALIAYRSPVNARNSALRRLVGAATLALGAAAVIWPNALSELAQTVGVGRGADLVLYVLAVVSLFVWLSLYRRLHELEHRLTQVSREIALQSVPDDSLHRQRLSN